MISHLIVTIQDVLDYLYYYTQFPFPTVNSSGLGKTNSSVLGREPALFLDLPPSSRHSPTCQSLTASLAVQTADPRLPDVLSDTDGEDEGAEVESDESDAATWALRDKNKQHITSGYSQRRCDRRLACKESNGLEAGAYNTDLDEDLLETLAGHADWKSTHDKGPGQAVRNRTVAYIDIHPRIHFLTGRTTGDRFSAHQVSSNVLGCPAHLSISIRQSTDHNTHPVREKSKGEEGSWTQVIEETSTSGVETARVEWALPLRYVSRAYIQSYVLLKAMRRYE
ncbi:unnamed protein product [Protopolystoma xenopodis]|uniref:Uncharacterized protein n=1 Tax=Protopolystoma xenopodis TaxID=117903 RepID=A0A448XKG6_9PLAT|nr:unnamed protein product [Protopolystoma xenopodis]